MEQNPSQRANSSSASQQILQILWNPTIYDRIHKWLPPASVSSQINPVHTTIPFLE